MGPLESKCKDDVHRYKLVLCGKLEGDMLPWFEGLNIEIHGNLTILTGIMRDQTELHGLLRKIHDLHQKLLSLEVVNGKL